VPRRARACRDQAQRGHAKRRSDIPPHDQGRPPMSVVNRSSFGSYPMSPPICELR
jgi:hypothetical protein